MSSGSIPSRIRVIRPLVWSSTHAFTSSLAPGAMKSRVLDSASKYSSSRSTKGGRKGVPSFIQAGFAMPSSIDGSRGSRRFRSLR